MPAQLELVPPAGKHDPHVAFVLRLEEHLAEGSYSKVLTARANVPNPYYAPFMDAVLHTVR